MPRCDAVEEAHRVSSAQSARAIWRRAKTLGTKQTTTVKTEGSTGVKQSLYPILWVRDDSTARQN